MRDRMFASRIEPGPRSRSIAAKLARVHWPLLITVVAAAAIGVMALYSVASGSFHPWAERHILRLLVGLALLLAVAVTPLPVWLTLSYPIYAVALGLLALVPLIGVEALGARRWLGSGELMFQPSEVMKVGLALALARFYQMVPADRVSRPLNVIAALALIAAPVWLTLRQPDLGTAVLFVAIGVGVMLLAGVNVLYFVAAAIAGGAAMPFVLARLHDYQQRRIETFLDPGKDPLGAGYHITQSKIALGAGGVDGRGFLQGTQGKLDFLPEKHTDFIFTMLGEEWGFVGAIFIIALYCLMLGMLLAMAMRCRSRFAALLCASMAVSIFVYAFINMAMVQGLVPVVGVPLPFISYGGSSMTTLLIGLGLAMSGYVHRDERLRRDDLTMDA